jgi:hypothetical protein
MQQVLSACMILRFVLILIMSSSIDTNTLAWEVTIKHSQHVSLCNSHHIVK